MRAAFFVSWDPNSLASLKMHYRDIDLLIPAQVHAVSDDGAITVIDYENMQNTFKTTPDGAIAVLKEDKLHQWMRSINIEIPMMGLLDNYDGINWRVKEMADMLASPAARKNLQQALVEFAIKSHESGIVVDFEGGAERFTIGVQEICGGMFGRAACGEFEIDGSAAGAR